MWSWFRVECTVWASCFLLWFHITTVVLYRRYLSLHPFICPTIHPISNTYAWLKSRIKTLPNRKLSLTSVFQTLSSYLQRSLWLLGSSASFCKCSMHVQTHTATHKQQDALHTVQHLKCSWEMWKLSILVHSICFIVADSCRVLFTVGVVI